MAWRQVRAQEELRASLAKQQQLKEEAHCSRLAAAEVGGRKELGLLYQLFQGNHLKQQKHMTCLALRTSE